MEIVVGTSTKDDTEEDEVADNDHNDNNTTNIPCRCFLNKHEIFWTCHESQSPGVMTIILFS